MDNDKPLNYRQSLFAEYYTSDPDTKGNATQSAIKAGYKETTAYSMGQRLLKKVEVRRVIDDRTQEIRAESVATRKKRQEFWSREMDNPENKLTDRLRASELLGKSEADFTDKHIVGTQESPEQSDAQRKASEAAAKVFKMELASEGHEEAV